jgi:hypothetical protein
MITMVRNATTTTVADATSYIYIYKGCHHNRNLYKRSKIYTSIHELPLLDDVEASLFILLLL